MGNNNIKIKTCKKCGFVGNESSFPKKGNLCKICNREYQNEWNRNKKIKEKDRVKDKIKTCLKCGFIGNENLFVNNTNVCKKCRNLYTIQWKKENPISSKDAVVKTCSKCFLTKERNYFPSRGTVCKQCKSEYDKEYRKNNPEKIKQKSKRYYKNNTEMLLRKSKDYAKNNPEKIKAQSKARRERNKEKIKERKKLDYQKNKEKVKARSKIWKDNNKEKARQVADKNHKDRMKNDPGYRLLKICGGLVGNMLRSSGSSKNGKSSKYYFPFNKEELKASIQNKFQSWMTWDNQGIYRLKTWIDNDILSYLWNLDHWIPQNLLPYSSMEDKNFRIAWDLANLRPISAKQNILENYRKTIDKIYTAQEYKDLCILIELLKEIIDNPINKPELIIFYESMIKAKEDYEN